MNQKRAAARAGTISRRRFVQLGLGAAGTLGAYGVRVAAAADAATRLDAPAASQQLNSLERAYMFLDFMMDAYQPGATLRLVQSYSDQQNLGSTAFVYDNALAIVAYLLRGKRDDTARARLLGDSLLYAQQHDPTYSDGRLRQAYWVGPFTLPFASNDAYFIRPDGSVNLVGAPFFFQGSAVGDMAWAAIALAQLFAGTRDRRYLDGAAALGNWIVDHAFDTAGLGGYRGGVDPSNQPLQFKSTEHNIDVYGLFNNLLAPLTHDDRWVGLGQHALEFVKRVWNAAGGFFYTGSNDGATINPSPVPEDTQSWSYLALLDGTYAPALDWAKTNLATTDTPQSAHSSFAGNLRLGGVTFSDVSRRASAPAGQFDPPSDPDAVWFEGSAHMAAALLARKLPRSRDLPTFFGDRETAELYLEHVQLAQDRLGRGQVVNGRPIPEATGIVAASSVLNTGFGFSYFPNLHIGATSWYCMAAQAGNPFRRLTR
jgi:hypothetical protein